MNDITVFIYLMGLAAVFGMTCVYMFMMMRSTLATFNNTPVKSYGDAMKAYKVPAPHPEMEGVKYGEELLVFSAEEEDDEVQVDDDVTTEVVFDADTKVAKKSHMRLL